jgi:hypothetical protein
MMAAAAVGVTQVSGRARSAARGGIEGAIVLARGYRQRTGTVEAGILAVRKRQDHRGNGDAGDRVQGSHGYESRSSAPSFKPSGEKITEGRDGRHDARLSAGAGLADPVTLEVGAFQISLVVSDGRSLPPGCNRR